MFNRFLNNSIGFLQRCVTIFMLGALFSNMILPPRIQAQMELDLPSPGTMILQSSAYSPVMVKGMTIFPDNPFKFDFIVHPGDDNLQGEKLKQEASKLINYFMASLTVPENEMWVNLSPYEKDRIVAQGLSQTELGRDMLSQDYLLKQLTASLMYPEEELGSEFWQKIYQKAQSELNTSEIPVNTFNKVWIVPEKATVFVDKDKVYVIDQYLKVMLEEDYLALENNLGHSDHGIGAMPEGPVKKMSESSKEVIREVLIPEIEREVNQGKNFAPLRQIFNSMILATWYKQNLKKSILGQAYINRNKVEGIDLTDKQMKEKIYQSYITAFNQGVFNFVKEDYDEKTQSIVPRKYFAGGIKGIQQKIETAVLDTKKTSEMLNGNESLFSVEFSIVEHNVFHELAGIQSVLEELFNSLEKKYAITKREGEYDFRTTVALHGRIDHTHGYLELAPNGVLIMVDDRFQYNHAGRNRRTIYARSTQEVNHKLEELRLWEEFVVAQKIMTEDQILQGQMGDRLVAWANQGTPETRLNRQNLLIETYYHISAAGLQSDGRHSEAEKMLTEIPRLETIQEDFTFDFFIAGPGSEKELAEKIKEITGVSNIVKFKRGEKLVHNARENILELDLSSKIPFRKVSPVTWNVANQLTRQIVEEINSKEEKNDNILNILFSSIVQSIAELSNTAYLHGNSANKKKPIYFHWTFDGKSTLTIRIFDTNSKASKSFLNQTRDTLRKRMAQMYDRLGEADLGINEQKETGPLLNSSLKPIVTNDQGVPIGSVATLSIRIKDIAEEEWDFYASNYKKKQLFQPFATVLNKFLEKLKSPEGMMSNDLQSTQPNTLEDAYNETILQKQLEVLQSIGLVNEVPGALGYYRFADWVRGLASNQIQELINELSEITIKDLTGTTAVQGDQRALYRFDLDRKTKEAMYEKLRFLMEKKFDPDQAILKRIMEDRWESLKNKNRKAYIFDIDGNLTEKVTMEIRPGLTREVAVLKPKSMQMIYIRLSKGIPVVLCSGRYYETSQEMKDIGDNDIKMIHDQFNHFLEKEMAIEGEERKSILKNLFFISANGLGKATNGFRPEEEEFKEYTQFRERAIQQSGLDMEKAKEVDVQVLDALSKMDLEGVKGKIPSERMFKFKGEAAVFYKNLHHRDYIIEELTKRGLWEERRMEVVGTGSVIDVLLYPVSKEVSMKFLNYELGIIEDSEGIIVKSGDNATRFGNDFTLVRHQNGISSNRFDPFDANMISLPLISGKQPGTESTLWALDQLNSDENELQVDAHEEMKRKEERLKRQSSNFSPESAVDAKSFGSSQLVAVEKLDDEQKEEAIKQILEMSQILTEEDGQVPLKESRVREIFYQDPKGLSQLIMQEDGLILGYLLAFPKKADASVNYMVHLGVRKKARKQHLATRMIYAMSLKEGSAIELGVRDNNSVAIKMYTELGFKKKGNPIHKTRGGLSYTAHKYIGDIATIRQNTRKKLENLGLEDFLTLVDDPENKEIDITPGGIDLNPNAWNIVEQGEKVQWTINDSKFQTFQPDSIQGLIPVIVNISPISHFD